jgi:hypothetical protein
MKFVNINIIPQFIDNQYYNVFFVYSNTICFKYI